MVPSADKSAPAVKGVQGLVLTLTLKVGISCARGALKKIVYKYLVLYSKSMLGINSFSTGKVP